MEVNWCEYYHINCGTSVGFDQPEWRNSVWVVMLSTLGIVHAKLLISEIRKFNNGVNRLLGRCQTWRRRHWAVSQGLKGRWIKKGKCWYWSFEFEDILQTHIEKKIYTELCIYWNKGTGIVQRKRKRFWGAKDYLISRIVPDGRTYDVNSFWFCNVIFKGTVLIRWP